jgi:hypothetical protein
MQAAQYGNRISRRAVGNTQLSKRHIRLKGNLVDPSRNLLRVRYFNSFRTRWPSYLFSLLYVGLLFYSRIHLSFFLFVPFVLILLRVRLNMSFTFQITRVIVLSVRSHATNSSTVVCLCCANTAESAYICDVVPFSFKVYHLPHTQVSLPKGNTHTVFALT